MSIRYFLYAFTVVWLSACSSKEKLSESESAEPLVAADSLSTVQKAISLPDEEAPFLFPEFKAPPGVEVTYYSYHFETLVHNGEGQPDSLSLEDLSDYYVYSVYFYYPQIKGIANKAHEKTINKELKPDIQAFLDSSPILLTSSVDSSNQKQMSYLDSGEPVVKVHRAISEDKLPRSFSEDHYSTSIDYLLGNFISVTYNGYFDGNMAAHPNFNERSGVIDLITNEPLILSSLLKGNFLPDVKKLFREAAVAEEPEENFCLEGSVKERWIDSLTEESEIAGLTESHLFLRADTRDFGCAEVARGIMEVAIPLEKLSHYMR